jgi:hypothetical protein
LMIKLDIQCGIGIQTVCGIENVKMKLIKYNYDCRTGIVTWKVMKRSLCVCWGGRGGPSVRPPTTKEHECLFLRMHTEPCFVVKFCDWDVCFCLQ